MSWRRIRTTSKRHSQSVQEDRSTREEAAAARRLAVRAAVAKQSLQAPSLPFPVYRFQLVYQKYIVRDCIQPLNSYALSSNNIFQKKKNQHRSRLDMYVLLTIQRNRRYTGLTVRNDDCAIRPAIETESPVQSGITHVQCRKDTRQVRS